MEQIKTKRLLMTKASISDLPLIEEIESECDKYFRFDPPIAAEHNRSLRECLNIGDVIPGVLEDDYKRENYHLYYIWKDGILIGWLAFYLEYQQNDTAYLSVLYITESNRMKGIGTEIIEALAFKLAGLQIKIIKTHCSLRNAISLSFWVKNGFDHITEIECTGNLTPENFGGIGLMKIIKPYE